MKVYTKKYIGKGQAVVTNSGVKLPIVKMVLSVEEMMQFVHTYKGKEYVSFEVSEMRKEDDYGNTHTVYHSAYEEEIVQAEEKPAATVTQKKKRGRPSKAEIAQKLEDAKRVEAMQNFTDPKTDTETQALKAEMQMDNADLPRDMPF